MSQKAIAQSIDFDILDTTVPIPKDPKHVLSAALFAVMQEGHWLCEALVSKTSGDTVIDLSAKNGKYRRNMGWNAAYLATATDDQLGADIAQAVTDVKAFMAR